MTQSGTCSGSNSYDEYEEEVSRAEESGRAIELPNLEELAAARAEAERVARVEAAKEKAGEKAAAAAAAAAVVARLEEEEGERRREREEKVAAVVAAREEREAAVLAYAKASARREVACSLCGEFGHGFVDCAFCRGEGDEEGREQGVVMLTSKPRWGDEWRNDVFARSQMRERAHAADVLERMATRG